MWDGNIPHRSQSAFHRSVEREPMWDGNSNIANELNQGTSLSENQCGMETLTPEVIYTIGNS